MLVLLLTSPVACAQDVRVSEGEPITVGQTFTLDSRILGEERELYLSLPENFDNSSALYPVGYVLGAEELGNFPLVRGMLDNYPVSAETYGDLAGGLRRNGQLEEAYELNEKAITLAQETNHPFLRYYLETREEYYSRFHDRENAD